MKDETLVSLHTNFYMNRSKHFGGIEFFLSALEKLKCAHASIVYKSSVGVEVSDSREKKTNFCLLIWI